MKELLIILIIFLYSCTSNNGDLELILLNTNINAYCADPECSNSEIYANYNEYIHKSGSKITFKIINHSNTNYVLNNIPSILDSSFPRNYSGLNLYNIIVKNVKNDSIVSFDYEDFSLSCRMIPYLSIKDSLIKNHYTKLNYDINKADKLNQTKENLIYINSGEVIYFETYISLPYNSPSLFSTQRLNIDLNNKYRIALTFDFDSTNVKNYLTWSQLKTIEENEYKFYQGSLESNSVPLVFIE